MARDVSSLDTPDGWREAQRIVVKPRRVGTGLAVVAVVLTFLSLITQALDHAVSIDFYGYETIIRSLNVDDEASFATWYNAVLLAIAAALLAIRSVRARSTDELGWDWTVLAVLFAALSADEIVGLHERTGILLQRAFGVSNYTWVFLGVLFGLVLLPWLFRFLARLPKRTRYMFQAAGVIYVGGALVVEGLSGVYVWVAGVEDIGYALIVSIEELFEMLGVVLFIAALLEYMASHGGIHVSDDVASPELPSSQ